MELVITGKQMKIAPGLKKFIEDRAQKMEKYGTKSLQATVTLKIEKYRQIAEAHVNSNGVILQAQEETAEMEESVDKVISKIEKQLKKHKEKVSSHRLHASEKKVIIGEKEAAVSLPQKLSAPPFIAVGTDVFRIPKREKVLVSLLAIEEALAQMKSNKKEFFFFRNSANRQLNFLYKKQNGILGLIDLIDGSDGPQR